MKLSVALCTYNGSQYLPTQLASIAAQTRLPDELIVYDDGSTDGTVDILRQFTKTAPFPVQLNINPNRLGTAANFTHAFALCCGDVVLPCDQDDYWLSDKLAQFESTFSDSSTGLVFSDAILADVDLVRSNTTAWEVLPFPRSFQKQFVCGRGAWVLARYNVVTGSAMAFRADLRDLILPVPDVWIPDAWIAFLIAAVSSVNLIPAPTIVYRQHESQQVGLSRRTLTRQIRAVLTGRDSAYYARLATRFALLSDRLEQNRNRLRDVAILEMVREKAAMAKMQASMRDTNRMDRTALALDMLMRGQYYRFDHGVRAFVADLLGP